MKALVPLVLLVIAVPILSAQTVLKTEFQDTQPKFILGADGQASGLCVEILGLLEKKSDLKFSYPAGFVPISRITGDLASGAIDVYFGLAKTPARERDFGFVGELFVTRYQILARRGDPAASFATVDALKASGLPVLAIRGAAPANYFATTEGLPVEDAPNSVEVALRQLKAGAGRLFGYYDLGNEWLLDSLGFRESLVALPIKFGTDGQWLCVSKSLPAATVQKLSRALEAAKKSPEWAAMMSRYFAGTK